MFDPSIISGLTAAIEAIINKALSYDPASQRRLASITDVLAIESTFPALTLYFRGTDEGLQVMSHCDITPQTRLKGSPFSLLNLLKQPTSLAGSGVELTGSIGLLQTWQQLLQDLEIDWEESISQVMGDIAGPLASQGIRNTAKWATSQHHEQQRLLKEFLTEEIKLIPSKVELENFYRDVTDLKLDSERLAARLAKLQTTFTATGAAKDK